MKTSQVFKVGKNDIVYVSDDFKKDFYDLPFEPSKKVLFSKELDKPMTSEEIQKELNPSIITLPELLNTLQSDEKNKEVFGFLAYVNNKDGVPRLVCVGWGYWRGCYGWVVSSYSVYVTCEWSGGHQVFSGNPFDSLTPSPFVPKLDMEITEIVVNGNAYRLVK